MKPSRIAGLENVTWKCNWNCVHCYFRNMPQLHTNVDTPLEELKRQIDAGKARGCEIVVLYGKGEPTLHAQINDIISYISSEKHMSPVIITNGSMGIKRYEKLYDLGLNHLHISVHGLGVTVDKIAERKGAGRKQMELLKWLHKNNLPFRTNITLQLLNHNQISDTVERVIQLGAFHVSLLNFLPHYKSTADIKAVAVNPIDLVSTLEKSMEYMERKIIFTLRYFPMCLLKPKFWKYVTNARYVIFDPWEYTSGRSFADMEEVWKTAVGMSDAVGIRTQPCSSCLLMNHCGGWNATYARIFDFVGLNTVKEVPAGLREAVSKRGGLFDLNPANMREGIAI